MAFMIFTFSPLTKTTGSTGTLHFCEGIELSLLFTVRLKYQKHKAGKKNNILTGDPKFMNDPIQYSTLWVLGDISINKIKLLTSGNVI